MGRGSGLRRHELHVFPQWLHSLSALDKQIKHLTQKQSVAGAERGRGRDGGTHKENTMKRASHT